MGGRKAVLLAVAVGSFLFSGSLRAADETFEAVQAAEEFLVLIDADDYDESWERAASVFQVSLPKEEWQGRMEVARSLFGHTLGRAVRSATFRRAMPGLPDGDYVIILFDSTFDHKAAAIEVVTPVREQDGVWRVSGYQIR